MSYVSKPLTLFQVLTLRRGIGFWQLSFIWAYDDLDCSEAKASFLSDHSECWLRNLKCLCVSNERIIQSSSSLALPLKGVIYRGQNPKCCFSDLVGRWAFLARIFLKNLAQYKEGCRSDCTDSKFLFVLNIYRAIAEKNLSEEQNDTILDIHAWSQNSLSELEISNAWVHRLGIVHLKCLNSPHGIFRMCLFGTREIFSSGHWKGNILDVNTLWSGTVFSFQTCKLGPIGIENCESLVPYFDEWVVSLCIFIYI